MKIPQLFIKIGNNKFIPIPGHITNQQLYFWDDLTKQIVADEGQLHLRVISGCPYLVLEKT